ncbi:unnamed protein product [Ectocarpus sp. CCAP 1310/34]|nr:unnamed protein product [Ectocarpus sp. CCAP 1310/34]
MEIAGHIDVLSEDSCILKPHRCIDCRTRRRVEWG